MIIGVTGRIATGKSTLSKILEERGFTRIDADGIYKKLRMESDEMNEGILKRFGTLENSAILRQVADDPDALNDLNELTHGFVVSEMERIIDKSTGDIVLDVPVPVKRGFLDTAEFVIMTDCGREVQVSRIIERDGCSRREALYKVNMQKERGFYSSAADAVINTDGMTSADLRVAVSGIMDRLRG